ncbi:metal-dependent hydrolase [Rhodothermaceae bacterium RA]|nr:metal-dependent hydrolase [Rhodothermaceae bacterium RA]
MSDDLRYPIGRPEPVTHLHPRQRQRCIADLAAAPTQLRHAVHGLAVEKLDIPYRPGGWTVRQVVHHLPDSHLNGYLRFRLGLTEDTPVIKPYDQDGWSALPDARTAPLEPSLALFDALHARWVGLLEALPPEAFRRTVRHPEQGLLTLDGLLALYAWHGRHHIAHITTARTRIA